MNNPDFTQLSQFVACAQKRLDLPLLAGCFADARPQPEIPSRAVGLGLILGEVVHLPSLLQLQAETKLPQWQRWVGYKHEISHDTFGYVSARLDPNQLRRAGVWICHKLKRGKAFEPNKIKGLPAVSLDANEEFCSDQRCCGSKSSPSGSFTPLPFCTANASGWARPRSTRCASRFIALCSVARRSRSSAVKDRP